MKIGVISDTHDFLDPQIAKKFSGVRHILHAGDIGTNWITFQLEQIAPVTAVRGNNDLGSTFRETETVELAGKKFLIHHIVSMQSPAEKFKLLIARAKIRHGTQRGDFPLRRKRNSPGIFAAVIFQRRINTDGHRWEKASADYIDWKQAI